MAELHAQGPAVGLLEAPHQLAERLGLAAVQPRRPVEVGLGEPELGELEPLGAAPLQPERVEVGLHVAEGPPGPGEPVDPEPEGLPVVGAGPASLHGRSERARRSAPGAASGTGGSASK